MLSDDQVPCRDPPVAVRLSRLLPDAWKRSSDEPECHIMYVPVLAKWRPAPKNKLSMHEKVLPIRHDPQIDNAEPNLPKDLKDNELPI
jgi:hypothetical protein